MDFPCSFTLSLCRNSPLSPRLFFALCPPDHNFSPPYAPYPSIGNLSLIVKVIVHLDALLWERIWRSTNPISSQIK